MIIIQPEQEHPVAITKEIVNKNNNHDKCKKSWHNDHDKYKKSWQIQKWHKISPQKQKIMTNTIIATYKK